MTIAIIIYSIMQLSMIYLVASKKLSLKQFIFCMAIIIFSPVLFVLITDYLGLHTTNIINNLNLEIQRSTK